MDDRNLVERLKAGDKSAFEVLVRLHFRSVYNVGFRYMGDHGGADEVVQETFVKAFNAIESFRGESSFKSWLLRIATNTALNAIRSRDRHSASDIADLDIKSVHRGFDRLEEQQTANILRAAVAQLPPKQRQALELRIYEDLSFKEVAEIMECPFDTAKANFRHAVTNLKKVLEAAEGGRGWAEVEQAFKDLGGEDNDHETG